MRFVLPLFPGPGRIPGTGNDGDKDRLLSADSSDYLRLSSANFAFRQKVSGSLVVAPYALTTILL